MEDRVSSNASGPFDPVKFSPGEDVLRVRGDLSCALSSRRPGFLRLLAPCRIQPVSYHRRLRIQVRSDSLALVDRIATSSLNTAGKGHTAAATGWPCARCFSKQTQHCRAVQPGYRFRYGACMLSDPSTTVGYSPAAC